MRGKNGDSKKYSYAWKEKRKQTDDKLKEDDRLTVTNISKSLPLISETKFSCGSNVSKLNFPKPKTKTNELDGYQTET